MAGSGTRAGAGGTSNARALLAGLGVMLGSIVPGFLVASLVLEIRQDFSLSDSTLGVALALFYVASAIAAPPAGRLIDRIGAVRGVYAAAALVVLSSLGIAALAGSAVSLTALLLVCGVGKALAQPGVGRLLARRVREERRGLAFGLQTSGAPGSALLAGLALPVIAIPFGWRWAFVAAALLVAASAAAVPRPALSRPGGGGPRPSPGVSAAAMRPVRVLAVASALASAAGLGMLSFLVVFAVDAGLSAEEAGLLLSASSLVSVLSRIGFGALADRRQGADILRQTILLLALCAIGLLMLATQVPALIVVGALAAVGVGWGWQALVNLSVVRQHPDAPATAMGIQVSGFFVGAVAGPLFVGFLAQDGLFTLAWTGCAVLAALAALAVAVARRLHGVAPPVQPATERSEPLRREELQATGGRARRTS